MSRVKDKHRGTEESQPSAPTTPAPAANGASPDDAPAADTATPPGAGPLLAASEPTLVPAPPSREAHLQDQLLRLRADFDNFRKRAQRERGEWTEAACEALMHDLLPVLDHFQLALQAGAGQPAVAAFSQGIQMTFHQLMGVLEKYGLNAFDAGQEPFDPARFEAISQLASETVPEGVVLAQTRRGYRLKTKLLRPAQVVVSRGREPAAPPPANAEHPAED